MEFVGLDKNDFEPLNKLLAGVIQVSDSGHVQLYRLELGGCELVVNNISSLAPLAKSIESMGSRSVFIIKNTNLKTNDLHRSMAYKKQQRELNRKESFNYEIVHLSKNEHIHSWLKHRIPNSELATDFFERLYEKAQSSAGSYRVHVFPIIQTAYKVMLPPHYHYLEILFSAKKIEVFWVDAAKTYTSQISALIGGLNTAIKGKVDIEYYLFGLPKKFSTSIQMDNYNCGSFAMDMALKSSKIDTFKYLRQSKSKICKFITKYNASRSLLDKQLLSIKHSTESNMSRSKIVTLSPRMLPEELSFIFRNAQSTNLISKLPISIRKSLVTKDFTLEDYHRRNTVGMNKLSSNNLTRSNRNIGIWKKRAKWQLDFFFESYYTGMPVSEPHLTDDAMAKTLAKERIA